MLPYPCGLLYLEELEPPLFNSERLVTALVKQRQSRRLALICANADSAATCA
jgi:hypothetical protein